VGKAVLAHNQYLAVIYVVLLGVIPLLEAVLVNLKPIQQEMLEQQIVVVVVVEHLEM